ncbi:hypothetical protein [Nostoc sp.]|uniref:hypothetical protein n=2 Tax=Nostoc sp. TaxID=1180 RepID=UPI002FFC9EA1
MPTVLINFEGKTMQSALRITTKVLPGNKIEIEIPEAEIGDSIDVFVILPEKTEPKHRSVLDIIEESRRRHPSRSAEDIDRQLQEERLSWDS